MTQDPGNKRTNKVALPLTVNEFVTRGKSGLQITFEQRHEAACWHSSSVSRAYFSIPFNALCDGYEQFIMRHRIKEIRHINRKCEANMDIGIQEAYNITRVFCGEWVVNLQRTEMFLMIQANQELPRALLTDDCSKRHRVLASFYCEEKRQGFFLQLIIELASLDNQDAY